MVRYYNNKLSAERLKQCYDIAPPRVRRYLAAEIAYVLEKIRTSDVVLELGCGYGRVLLPISQKAGTVIGIDTSFSSLTYARNIISNCYLFNMDAVKLAFRDKVFDIVVCIQNGISAFNVNQHDLIRESIRVTKPGGTILFSSYSDKFWYDRLKWFQLQADAGLVGKIDYEKTGKGVIFCEDGFKATTVRQDEFLSLITPYNVSFRTVEVDESSIFYEIIPLKD